MNEVKRSCRERDSSRKGTAGGRHLYMHGFAELRPAAGLERTRRVNWKHGRYSKEGIESPETAV